jgi:hypothetical protein
MVMDFFAVSKDSVDDNHSHVALGPIDVTNYDPLALALISISISLL